MSLAILGIGTAVPAEAVDQATARRLAETLCCRTAEQATWLPAMYGNTGIKKRDDHLRSAEFFNVANFPEITFKSHSVKQTGTQSGDITGDLTMHGVTKPITLHVKLLTPPDSKQTRWSVTTDLLKRRDFNLMFAQAAESMSGISQTVAVNIEIEAVRAQ